MKGLRLPLAFALGVMALSPAPAADTKSGSADRDFIVEGERKLSKAYVTGDTGVLSRLLSDDFRGIGSKGGLYGKTEALEELRKGVDQSGADPTEIDVQIFGDTAIARVRETQTGLAPELKPAWRVITDTWIRRAGKWQVIAAEELNPGVPTLPAYNSAIAEIEALRAATNRAIAAHDPEALLPYFAEDAVFAWGDGSSAVGRAALKADFAEDFSNPLFVTYIRTPETIAISDTGKQAVEHGTWTGLRHEPRGETRSGGDYTAHWLKSPQGWRIQGEVYVKLRCTGPLCEP